MFLLGIRFCRGDGLPPLFLSLHPLPALRRTVDFLKPRPARVRRARVLDTVATVKGGQGHLLVLRCWLMGLRCSISPSSTSVGKLYPSPSPMTTNVNDLPGTVRQWSDNEPDNPPETSTTYCTPYAQNTICNADHVNSDPRCRVCSMWHTDHTVQGTHGNTQ